MYKCHFHCNWSSLYQTFTLPFFYQLLSLYSPINAQSSQSLRMHSSSSSSHSQRADVSHFSPLFLLFSSLHFPPLSSHTQSIAVKHFFLLFSSLFPLNFLSSHSVMQCPSLVNFPLILSSHFFIFLFCSISLSLPLTLSPWAGGADSRILWLMFPFGLFYPLHWRLNFGLKL